jgi:hypothetical protein
MGKFGMGDEIVLVFGVCVLICDVNACAICWCSFFIFIVFG